MSEIPVSSSDGSAGEPLPPLKKRPFSGAFNLLAVCTAIAYIAYVAVSERGDFVAALSIEPARLAAVAALLSVYFLLYSYRFVILIEQHCDCRIGLLAWFRMLVVVRFMNNVVPQMGTVYRGVRLKRDFGVSYTDYIAANLFFIWSDTMFNFGVAAILLAATRTHLELWGIHAAVVLGAALMALLAAPCLSKVVLGKVSVEHRKIKKIIEKLAVVADELNAGLRDFPYMVKINLVALLSFISMALVFGELLEGLGITIPLPTLAVFYALYRLTFHINITPGNIGIREVAFGLLCTQADVALSKGVIVSTELRVISILVLIILGVVFASGDLKEAWRSIRSRTPAPS